MRRKLWPGLRVHARSNVVAYLALVLAMSGTAGALRGTNSVTSDDISRGEVRKADIVRAAVTTAAIRSGGVTNADLAPDSVDGSKVAAGSITYREFAGDSVNGFHITDLTGADVVESTLSEVPLARGGGKGRAHYDHGCDPTSTAYIVCATMIVDMTETGRLLVLASGNGPAADGTSATGTCTISTSATGGFGAVTLRNEEIGDYAAGGEFQISVVTPPIGPGDIQVEVHCNQSVGNIVVRRIFMSAVQISAS